jgi:peptidylprolyl isomerase
MLGESPTAVRLALVLALAAAPGFAVDPIPAPPDVAAPPADAVVSATGLASKVLRPGTGTEHPGPTAWVRVHYTGWTTDGEMFDSSVAREKAVSLPLDTVIQGWTEGVQLMVEGEQRRFWIPQELAYAGREDRPAGTLVFDVELLEIVHPPAPPENLTAPPADAEMHKRGLASKVLQVGHGDRNPKADSAVSVLYTGWTTDGKVFDSTVYTGQPVTFPLSKVIKGWTEGLQLMVEGEKRRFWIPEKLAYGGAEGKPQGMLIFDIELVAINIY